jgi:NAD(P)-dependent dehydrogenase (short-subunit alcohol dehydrogenase family)
MAVLDLFDLTGQMALVTGGARGIGFAIASAMAEAGAKVAIVDRDGDQATQAATAIVAATGSTAIAVQADVSISADTERMVAETVDRFGKLDICFANAGIAEPGLPILDLEDYSPELWQQIIAVNLSGVYFTGLAAARAMKRQGGGRIINMASIVGMVADASWGSIGYCSAKGGVVQLTRQLAVMLAPHAIRVNAIAPGYVTTGMSEAEQSDNADPLVQKLQADCLARTPMKRFAQADEIKGIALFLASEASSYCTGAIYPVDGGWLAA